MRSKAWIRSKWWWKKLWLTKPVKSRRVRRDSMISILSQMMSRMKTWTTRRMLLCNRKRRVRHIVRILRMRHQNHIRRYRKIITTLKSNTNRTSNKLTNNPFNSNSITADQHMVWNSQCRTNQRQTCTRMRAKVTWTASLKIAHKFNNSLLCNRRYILSRLWTMVTDKALKAKA